MIMIYKNTIFILKKCKYCLPLLLLLQETLYGQAIPIQTEAHDRPFGILGQKGALSEFLPLIHIGDMYLNDGCGYRGDSIRNGNCCMGISSGIKHDTVVGKADFMQLVDDGTLTIMLKIIQFQWREASLQSIEILLERLIAVDAFFPLPQ